MGNVFNKFGGTNVRVDELFTGRQTAPGTLALDLSDYRFVLICVYGGSGTTQSPVLAEVGTTIKFWGGSSYGSIYDAGHPNGSLIDVQSTGITLEHEGIAVGAVYGIKGLEHYTYEYDSGIWCLKLVKE